MRIAIIGLLTGMLIAAGYCVVLIWKIEAVYSKIWGSDVSITAWQRKRWGFLLIAVAQLVAVLSLFADPKVWISLVYILLMFFSLCLFCDSYRLLLDDLKRLPRKK